MSFWKIWNSEEEGREGESAPQTDQLHTTEQLLIIALFLSPDKVSAVWASLKSGHSRQDLHPCFTPVVLLFPLPQFTGWNTARLYIDLRAVRKKSIKLFMFLLVLWLYQDTARYCDQLWGIAVRLFNHPPRSIKRNLFAAGAYWLDFWIKNDCKTSLEDRLLKKFFLIIPRCPESKTLQKHRNSASRTAITPPTVPTIN